MMHNDELHSGKYDPPKAKIVGHWKPKPSTFSGSRTFAPNSVFEIPSSSSVTVLESGHMKVEIREY